MIKSQLIEIENKPVAIILDYKEYLRLKEIEEDKSDYYSALKTKLQNKKWFAHNDLKKELGIK